MSTGFLWDTAVDLVYRQDYNGIELTDSNFVDIPRLYDMIKSINSASVRGDTISVNNSIGRIQRNSTINNAIVGFLFQPYNYIVSDALTNNLISYSNGVVNDSYVNGVWQNPYGEDVLIGHAVGNDGVVSKDVSFTIENLDSLSTLSFSRVQFDAGDGVFRDVTIGSPFSVHYTEGGLKETKLMLTKGGVTFISHCLVQVVGPPANTNNASIEFLETHEVTIYDGSNYYKGMVSYRADSSFENPLIVAECFDPWPVDVWKKTINTHSYSGFSNAESFSKKLDSLQLFPGYDMFYVDWFNPEADIRSNAKVLEEVIKWVNSNKTSSNSNIIIGQSMGGLIARYCLCDMENRSVAHDTKLFISHDAPHLGANVSPGYMFAYWNAYHLYQLASPFVNLIESIKDLLQPLMQLGGYTSIKQMLPNYISINGVYDNALYSSLQQELQQTGFPKGDPGKPLESVAIVNGGRTVEGSLCMYDATTSLLNADIDISTGIVTEILWLIYAGIHDLPCIPGRTSLHLRYNIYPYLSHGSTATWLKLTYTKKLLWLWDINFDVLDIIKNNPSQGLCLDSYSSSYFDIGHLNVDPDVLDYQSPDYGWAPFFGAISSDSNMEEHLAFVPSASALCYNNCQDYNRDFYSNPPKPREQVPFDGYIIRDIQSEHISLGGFSEWFQLSSSEINVPPVVFSGDTLRVSGTTAPFKWTSSSETVASVDSLTGIIGNTTNGIAEFTASYLSLGQAMTKSREALVGYPQVTLSIESINTNRVIVKTNPIESSYNVFISDAVSKGILSYKWGVKLSSGEPIMWRTTQNDTLRVELPSTISEPITVYMKWTRGTEDEPTPREIQFLGNGDYSINIELIEVGKNNTITYVESFPTTGITAAYGHTCLVFKRGLSTGNYPTITSISINGVSFPVSQYFVPPLNSYIYYVSDILYTTFFQRLFMPGLGNIAQLSNVLYVVTNTSTGPGQVFRILIHKRTLPFH